MSRFKKGGQPRTPTLREAAQDRHVQSYSYHARRSDDQINTGRQLKRDVIRPAASRFGKFWLKRYGVLVLLIAAIASLVNVLSLSTTANVVVLDTQGLGHAFLQDRAVYQDAANKLLAGSIWNRNKLTIDTNKVSQDLVKQFPELVNASVALPVLAHRPVVYVQPAVAALVLVAHNGSFVIDTNGRALMAAASGIANTLNIPTVIDQTNRRVVLSQQALSSLDVSFIQAASYQLDAKNIGVDSLTLLSGTRELDVKIQGQPYYVKFNLESGTGRQQAGTFIALYTKLQSDNVTPAQYVDVRVDGRAYYK